MKPTNLQKERIITLVNTLLIRSELSIDQVVARMQVDGCTITRNTFENRFTTRVHQKPNIPPEWFLSLIRAFTQNLEQQERCTPDEALELFQLARLPLDTLTGLQQLYPEQLFKAAIEKLLPVSYANLAQSATDTDNSLTVSVGQLSGLSQPQVHNSADLVPKADWGDAPDIRIAVGRADELQRIVQWIQDERCRLIGIFGMSGIGKTLLAAQVAQQLHPQFDRIYWTSLRSAPPLNHLLSEWLQFLTGAPEEDLPTTVKQLSTLLLRRLRKERCLLILDGYEHLEESGDIAGTYRIGYEAYAHWLRQLAELSHQSCILFTSQEKPLEFVTLSNGAGPVRSLLLRGLDLASLHAILEPQGIHGSTAEWQQIASRYSGNPLALKSAAEPINELFGGDLASFLNSEVSLFQVIRDNLDQQFGRLSLLEREMLYWLIIEREAVSLETLQDNIGNAVPKLHLLEALRSLLRRSLIEQQSNRFVVPHLVQAYISERLIELVVSEISAGMPLMLAGFALIKTQIKEYLREAQMREIIQPIVARLSRFAGQQEVEKKLFAMLHALQHTPSYPGNYCAGNLFNLLVQLNSDLRGRDLSHLEIYQGDLRVTNLQDANFAHATFHASRFWESFASIAALAFSPNGTYIAAGMTNGELFLWSLKNWELRYRIPSHTDMIWSVTFSPDGSLLATGSEDQMVCVWDVASGECLLRISAHEGWVKSVCFLNGNAQLATAGHDAKVRLWDITTGECLKSWQAHNSWIWSIAISPDGKYLATAGQDHAVKLWDLTDYQCVRILARHTEPVRTVAFSPDGQLLLSAGFDQLIAVWEVDTGHCLQLMSGHENLIWSAAFSADGKEIVSGGDDQQILIWQTETGTLLRTIEGHQNRLWAVAFHPNGDIVASGGDDQRLRFWNSADGRPIHYIEGYSNQIWAVAYNHREQQLAAGGDDGTIRIWDYQSGQCGQLLQGHSERVRGIAFSSDGAYMATSSDDTTVRIWDVRRNSCLHTLYGHQNRVWSVSFDAQGKRLISCSEDQTIRIWDTESGQMLRTMHMESGRIWSIAGHPIHNLLASSGDAHEILLWDIDTGKCISACEGHTARVWHLCFNHDGSLLVSGSADHTVCIWETATGRLLHRLTGHRNAVWAVAFSPTGQTVASGGDDYQVRVWDVQSGELCHEFDGHEGCVWTLAFIEETILASGSQDETIRLWDLEKAGQIRLLRSERPYERMDITGVQGLTEAQKMSLYTLGAIER